MSFKLINWYSLYACNSLETVAHCVNLTLESHRGPSSKWNGLTRPRVENHRQHWTLQHPAVLTKQLSETRSAVVVNIVIVMSPPMQNQPQVANNEPFQTEVPTTEKVRRSQVEVLTREKSPCLSTTELRSEEHRQGGNAKPAQPFCSCAAKQGAIGTECKVLNSSLTFHDNILLVICKSLSIDLV